MEIDNKDNKDNKDNELYCSEPFWFCRNYSMFDGCETFAIEFLESHNVTIKFDFADFKDLKIVNRENKGNRENIDNKGNGNSNNQKL